MSIEARQHMNRMIAENRVQVRVGKEIKVVEPPPPSPPTRKLPSLAEQLGIKQPFMISESALPVITDKVNTIPTVEFGKLKPAVPAEADPTWQALITPTVSEVTPPRKVEEEVL